MKRNTRSILLTLLLIAMAILAAGCGDSKSPYEINDSENYTVSVKFDANGGSFTTNTAVIVDSYNPTEVKKDGEGKGQIALIPPESESRGKNKFEATNSGYFLAGWYKTCTVTEGSDGQKLYTYADKWNFETDRLTIDPNGKYSSAEPVMTLYAAWVPLFSVEYYDLATGELITKADFNPLLDAEIALPLWNEETGALDMKDVPTREGYTFNAMYLDAEGKQPVTTETLTHTGSVDEATATATDSTMKVYVDWTEGTWFKISTVDQLIKNARLDGYYEILADLDFTDKFWPTMFMYGEFTGKIVGNGHTISNIRLEQTDNSRTAAGLFGKLADTASIADLKFNNVEFVIKAGARLVGTSYGLLAGVIAEKAQITDLLIENSTLKIDSGAYFATEDYVIGLVCGTGSTAVSAEGITCEATGDAPETIVVTVAEDGTVTVTPAA